MKLVRRLPLLLVVPLLVAAPATARLAQHGPTRALTEVPAPTPRFGLPHYTTSGRIPKVVGATTALRRVNADLRQAVRDDQRAYAKTARAYVTQKAWGGGPNGIYRTWFVRSLTSASTVVVSALIPSLELYPDGNDGEAWISGTVDVRTGERVSLRNLVANRHSVYRAIAADWGKALVRAHPRWCHPCRAFWRRYRPSYPATFEHLRTFALTPAGLAVGFPQYPTRPRMVAVIPYRELHGFLSPMGLRLVAGVRRSIPGS